jgi:hypothetical protein
MVHAPSRKRDTSGEIRNDDVLAGVSFWLVEDPPPSRSADPAPEGAADGDADRPRGRVHGRPLSAGVPARRGVRF